MLEDRQGQGRQGQVNTAGQHEDINLSQVTGPKRERSWSGFFSDLLDNCHFNPFTSRVSKVCALLVASIAPGAGITKSAEGGEPFIPNDPYYSVNSPVGSLGQWYLDKQTSGAAVDINVKPAWARGLTGQGITVGVVDEGIQYTHPDLAPNSTVTVPPNMLS